MYDAEAQDIIRHIHAEFSKSRDEQSENKEEPKPEAKKREFKFQQKPFSDKTPQLPIPKF